MRAVDFAGLLALFERARRQATALQRPILAVGACPAPDLDPLRLYESHRQGFFWSARQPDLTLFGYGCAWQAQARGEQRMADIQRQWDQLCADAWVEGPKSPLLLGSMRFDGQQATAAQWAAFADASFHLAHWLISEDASGRWLRCQRCVEADSDPAALARDSLAAYQRLQATAPSAPSTPEVLEVIERNALPAALWQAKVDAALQAIDAGELSKVVLARHIEYRLDAPWTAAWRCVGCTSSAAIPTCSPALHRGTQCFMGATPERLLASQGGQLRTHALAGSARRGCTMAEDEALGAKLLADAKERHEHQLVVRTILQGLDGLVSDLRAASQPTLLKLATVQHLSTPLQARLQPGRCLLEGVQALHPTPAVGGLPTPQARSFIRRHEGFDRGWYAAPLGWLDAEGNGDFLVALRCALLTPEGCHLFAGCGIVQGSRPADEYQETQIKLSGMEQALRLATQPSG